MNEAHLHILINHLPVFGSILGAIVMIHGLRTRTNQTLIAAYYLIVIAALGAVGAYLTGEGAEDILEKIPGISKDAIEEHEDAAWFANFWFIILGLAAVVSIFFTFRKPQRARTFGFIMLVLTLFSFSVVARTAYLGGQIRHTEIHDPVGQHEDADGQEHDENELEDDDD